MDSSKLVQTVLPYEDCRMIYPAIVQEKYDGVFCIAKLIDDKVRIFSRTGKEFSSMNHLQEVLKEVFLKGEYQDCLIFFEAYIPNTNQATISGLCRAKEQCNEIKAVVHDLVPMNVYKGKADMPYSERFNNIRRLYSDSYNSSIILPVTITAYGYKEISDFVGRIWNRNGEGVIVKRPGSTYKRGERSSSMMKIKKENTYDLEVIGIIEGKGRFKGTTGKLQCRFIDGNIVTVGTGFSEVERNLWYKNPELILGEIVEIGAMGITKNNVLREPRFRGIRYDKQFPDY